MVGHSDHHRVSCKNCLIPCEYCYPRERQVAKRNAILGACRKGQRTMAIELNVNGKAVSVEADPAMPLLWALREDLQLTGTKFGCGIGACGACSVHINGEVARSCSVTLGDAAGKSIATIEALGGGEGQLSKLQQAWIAEQVPQCGYCQSGQLMAAAALLKKSPNPTDAQIDEAMTNICRCGTYPRIRKAIRAALSAT
jgi:isoquinoline 1-oxidoreductase subunit alpha